MSAIAFPTSTPLAEGQQIAGCYLLKQPLTAGNQREIWLARDEVLGKDVTLYFLPESILQDARAMMELRQEVKRNRQLSHPNILRIYDFVEDGGHVAITMDKLDAECLADLLQRKGAFEGQEIKTWMTQLAETLSDAHRIQLFHRDLSPANLFVRAGGKIVVTNFGISRLICEALERVGEAKGEAAHLAGMSPQLLDGERPTASDDVYGVGALAFTLLTGRAPFTGENLVPQIRKTTPLPVNEVRAADRRAPVSTGWEHLVAACLAKTPEQRPKSCGEVVTLLAQEKAAPVAEPSAAAALPVMPVAPMNVAPSNPVPPVTRSSPAREVVRASVPPEVKAPESKPVVENKAPAEPKATEVARTAPAPSTPKNVSDSVPNLPPPAPAMKPKPKPAPLSANYPDLERPKSKMPIVAVLLAAAALGTATYFKNTDKGEDIDASTNGVTVNKAVTSLEDGAVPPAVPPGETEAASNGDEKTAGLLANGEDKKTPETNSPTGEPPAVLPGEPTAAGKPLIGAEPKGDEPLVVVKNEGKKKNGAKVAEPKEAAEPKAAAEPAPAGGDGKPAPTASGKTSAYTLTNAPQPLPKLVVPPNATPEQLNQLLAERHAAAEEFAKAAEAAEKVQAANTTMRDVRQLDFDDQKKSLEEKKKTLAPVIKAATEAEAEKKRLEDSMARTEAAAKEAAKAADTAKTAYEQLLANSGEKLAAREKAEAELKTVSQTVADGTRQLDELSQGATKAESQRQQMLIAKRQAEQDLQTLTTALEKSTKSAREAMVKANKPKIEAVEKQIKELDGQIERYQKALASLQAIDDESAKVTIGSLQGKITAATAQKVSYQENIKQLSGLAPVKAAPAVAPTPPPTTPTAPVTPVPAHAPAAPTKPPTAAAASPVPVMPSPLPTNPAATPVSLTTPPEATSSSTEAAAGGNSLGMKFVPVGDVQFSVNLVTRKNFQVFADGTNLKSEHWKNPGFAQTPDHPVVNVTWKEADSFCKWLTDKEHKNGGLKSAEGYRLPTDLEWSKAVGLPAETGATPEDRDMGVADVYPWGNQWPPPEGSGNFAGEETVTELPIMGYNDKFANTSPVGSFKPNKAGLYDMGGNVWQWVQDSFDNSGNSKTLRGGSWYNGSIKISLLSSCRIKSPAETINDTYGFRIVKAAATKAPK